MRAEICAKRDHPGRPVLARPLPEVASVAAADCNVYIYFAEAFPTSVRSTAFGLLMGVGRTGGVVSTALGGVLPSIQLAFCTYAAAFALGGACVLCFTFETARKPLADAI